MSLHHLSSVQFFHGTLEKLRQPHREVGVAQNELATIPPSCGRSDDLHIEACAAAVADPDRDHGAGRGIIWEKLPARGPRHPEKSNYRFLFHLAEIHGTRMVYRQLQFFGGHTTSIE